MPVDTIFRVDYSFFRKNVLISHGYGQYQALFRTSTTKEQQDKDSALFNLPIKTEFVCFFKAQHNAPIDSTVTHRQNEPDNLFCKVAAFSGHPFVQELNQAPSTRDG